MFGPRNAYDGRRYFGGIDTRLLELLDKRIPQYVNSGTIGAVGQNLPIAYGNCKLTDLPALAMQYGTYDGKVWKRAITLVAEGECAAVDINSIKLDGDAPGQPPLKTTPVSVYSSVVIFWGSTGQKEAFAYPSNTTLDTYIKCPALLNDDDGYGNSISDIFALYVWVNTGSGAVSGDDMVLPKLDVVLTGRKTRTIMGWITDNSTYTTNTPDPIEVAVDYCVNGKFGPRLDISRIDLESALAASQYCRELVLRTDEGHTTEYAPRFMFNGALTEDENVEHQLAKILENCNGYYIPKGRKLFFGIRKAEDLSSVDALKPFTDTGTDRNILRNKGKSTLTVENTAGMDGYINQLEVKFNDSQYGYQENTLYIYDEARQMLASNVIGGDTTRTVNSEELELVGTTSLDQAQRLGVLSLREKYMKKIKYTFSIALKDGATLVPGDVRRLVSHAVAGDTDKRLASDIYVRVWEVQETDKFTATILAHPHNNDYYDNDAGTVY